MTLDEYQTNARKTAIYPALGGAMWAYPAFGLSGEAGEIANKLKKVIRDDSGQVTKEVKQALKDELGDVLWYLSEIARQLDLSLEDIASENIKKLSDRKERGKLHGSGDKR